MRCKLSLRNGIVVVALACAAVLIPTASAQARSAPITSAVTSVNTLSYGIGTASLPGVITSRAKVYLVFWGSQWGSAASDAAGNLTFANDPDRGAPYIQNLFRGLGTAGERWSGTLTQYCGAPDVSFGATSCLANATHIPYPSGGVLAGVWYDAASPQPDQAPWDDFAAEAEAAATHFGNTTPQSNRAAMYVLLSASGTNPERYRSDGGFCGGHRANDDGSLGLIAAVDLPYVMDAGQACGAGFVNPGNVLDAYSITATHEYAETLTNETAGGGWFHNVADSHAGEEIADLCTWLAAADGGSADVRTRTGTFAMSGVWSNDTNRCEIAHPIVRDRHRR